MEEAPGRWRPEGEETSGDRVRCAGCAAEGGNVIEDARPRRGGPVRSVKDFYSASITPGLVGWCESICGEEAASGV